MVTLFSSARLRYVFYSGLFLMGRTPTLPTPLQPENVQNYAFPISGAKVLLFFDTTKFYGHKIAKYVVKHKKRGEKPPLFQTNNPIYEPDQAVGATLVRSYFLPATITTLDCT